MALNGLTTLNTYQSTDYKKTWILIPRTYNKINAQIPLTPATIRCKTHLIRIPDIWNFCNGNCHVTNMSYTQPSSYLTKSFKACLNKLAVNIKFKNSCNFTLNCFLSSHNLIVWYHYQWKQHKFEMKHIKNLSNVITILKIFKFNVERGFVITRNCRNTLVPSLLYCMTQTNDFQ